MDETSFRKPTYVFSNRPKGVYVVILAISLGLGALNVDISTPTYAILTGQLPAYGNE